MLRCALLLLVLQASHASRPDLHRWMEIQRSESVQGSDLAISQWVAESARTGADVAAVAEALPDGPAKEFLSLLSPCAPCKEFQRVGEDHDGGYIMCADGLDQTLEGAFSFGIRGYDGWGMGVSALYNLPVHEYDCYHTEVPEVCEGCDVHFHPLCVGNASMASSEASWTTLSEEMATSGLGQASRSLLLKIDIEGGEVPLLLEEPIENLRKARQVILELHFIDPTNKDWLEKNLAVARKMKEAGFVVAHLHGNNCCDVAVFEEFSIPSFMELTYVLEPSGGCVAGLPSHLPLDQANVWNVEEIADPVLPVAAPAMVSSLVQPRIAHHSGVELMREHLAV